MPLLLEILGHTLTLAGAFVAIVGNTWNSQKKALHKLGLKFDTLVLGTMR